MIIYSAILLALAYECVCQSELYIGKKLGELKSYHHQVGGDIYAVNEDTLLIKEFTYDGNGKDTFFWAGNRPRPGPQGFLVPNEYGRTNVLDRYLNEDITIKLPDGKKISDIKSFSVYDLTRLESFGDIEIFDGFEPPQQVILPRFKSRSERVSSADVVVVDSKTLLVNDFTFDGRGETYFWVGLGPQPHAKGKKIPDEHGYMTPLRRYRKNDIRIILPGEMDVFNTDWLALYDVTSNEILGHIIIPDELNVPPSLVIVTPHETPLPNCEQLHRNMQLSWEIFGNQITVELAVKMGENDYAAFGISGSTTEPQMVGGDAFYVYRDTYNGYIYDLNLTSYFPCTKLVARNRGVCEDVEVGGQNNYQLMKSTRIDGVSTFTYRRPLVTPDDGDLPYPTNEEAMVIWAMGELANPETNPKPAMHYAWSKYPQPLSFSRTSKKQCFAFTHAKIDPPASWKPVHLTHPSQNLTFQLGPDGGPRGYGGITKQPSITGMAWYVDGFLVPELYLRRGKKYSFYVYGGSNPYEPTTYHPLIITDEPRGAFSQLKEDQQKEVRIFAGVDRSVLGDIRPKRGGSTRCLWSHPRSIDRRRDIDRTTFADFRNSLALTCDDEPDKVRANTLHLMPNRSWPDTLYYNSWTGANMGWKLHILDSEEVAISTG